MNQLKAATELHKKGWNVVPAVKHGKIPVGAWKTYQSERVSSKQLEIAFGNNTEYNFFVVTGSISRLAVLDCDDKASVKHWRKILGPVMEETTRVSTGKGYHFYFRLKENQLERGQSSSDPDCKWDLRAEGGGVIAPPSVHKSGRQYTWVLGYGLEALKDAPETLFKHETGTTSAKLKENIKSGLADLLNNPSSQGNRNVWLTKVAGHYAKQLLYYDSYELHVKEAATKLNPPLSNAETKKLIDSVWTTERNKLGLEPLNSGHTDEKLENWRQPLLKPTEETGWLATGGVCIMVQTMTKVEDVKIFKTAKWMDADLEVVGVIESNRERTYELNIHKPLETLQGVLSSNTVSDPRKLNAWLANYGVSIAPPDNANPYKIRDTARLTRYLEAQETKTLEAVDALGWHDKSQTFLTHNESISENGPMVFDKHRPDPKLKGWAPYRYGFGNEDDTKQILSELLTFHHEEVAAVFASWWATCFLKPQIQAMASQFPFMALEAASESGKSTGFFSLMLQLSGNEGGNSNPTRAALRDYLSAHRNGIVWMDDLDNLEHHGELLRNVTVGGSIVKKGQDNTQQIVAEMRAALIISGESLGLHGQKALLDRAILLEVTSPIHRMSFKKPDRPQWDDILNLKNKHPDLTEYAGTMVKLVLQQNLVPKYDQIRNGAGRHVDKVAVIRFGALLLNTILENQVDWVQEQTEKWVESLNDLGAENVLTLRMIPAALASTGWQTHPVGPELSRRTLTTPAFIEDRDTLTPTVWFSPQLLASWYEREPPLNKRIDQRVESAEALMQQARALGMGGTVKANGPRKRWRLATGEGLQVYWRCPPELSRLLIERSTGEHQENTRKESQ